MRKSARRAFGVALPCALLLFLTCRVVTVRAEATRARSGQHHACIVNGLAVKIPSGICRPRARSYPPAVVGAIPRAIYDAAVTFGVPYRVLMRIARCESGLNPEAVNGRHYGLFQFLPKTFRRGARSMRSMTGIVAYTYWSPRDSAYVAGFLFAVGQSPDWTCR